MQAAVEHFGNLIEGLNAGRAHPNLLNGITVEYYGSPTTLKQVAAIYAATSRLLVVQAFDAQLLPDIAKAIASSNLHLNPQRVGATLHLTIPNLSQERREELVKHVKQLAEKQRIVVRHLRREGRNTLSQKDKVSVKAIDDLTKTTIQQIDTWMEEKITVLRGADQDWKRA